MRTLGRNISDIMQALPGSDWAKKVIERMASELPRGADSDMGTLEFMGGFAGTAIILPINGAIATISGCVKTAIDRLHI